VLGNVLRAYLGSAPQLLATLREALACGNATAVRQAAHSLKSASANVGALAVAAHCKEIEAMGRANTLTNATMVLQHIEADYALVDAALTAELDAISCSPQAMGPLSATGADTSGMPLPDTFALALTDDAA
jgi:HPt (histidine-containing phosphotransfer) domain-containing protein